MQTTSKPTNQANPTTGSQSRPDAPIIKADAIFKGLIKYANQCADEDADGMYRDSSAYKHGLTTAHCAQIITDLTSTNKRDRDRAKARVKQLTKDGTP